MNNVLNIGILCYEKGSTLSMAQDLALELSKRGNKVHFISKETKVRLDLLSHNVVQHEIYDSTSELSQLYEIIKTNKIKFLQLHINESILNINYKETVFKIKELLNIDERYIQVYSVLHNYTLYNSKINRSKFKIALNNILAFSDKVISTSEALKEKILNISDINRELLIIPNYIRTEHHRSILNKAETLKKIKDKQRIIIHVTDFMPLYKSLDVFNIFYEIQKTISSKLYVIGDGPLKYSAKKLCKELGIENKVIFFGDTDEINKIFCVGDLLLQTHKIEDYENLFLKAMLYGLPIISEVSDDTNDIKEIIEPFISGILNEGNDQKKIVKDIFKIFNNKFSLMSYKKGAKSTAKKFEIKNVIKNYERIYYDYYTINDKTAIAV